MVKRLHFVKLNGEEASKVDNIKLSHVSKSYFQKIKIKVIVLA